MSDFLDRVRVTVATTGQGTVTLGAAYSPAFCTMAEAGAVGGRTFTYVLEEGNDFEIGRGVYTAAGPTLTRGTVLLSKIGGTAGTTKMTLAGSATLRIVAAAEDFMAMPAAIPASGRLTLTSGTPITTADVTAATTIYFTPVAGDQAPIYDGASWRGRQFSELSLALSTTGHLAGKNFDIFLFSNAGNPTLGTGPDWTAGAVAGSNTARGTGAGSTEIEIFEGRYVNKNAITLRNGATTYSVAARQATLLGTFRTVANGQTEDSASKRFLSNVYNSALRFGRAVDTTDSWTYAPGAAAYRQANASAANQVEYVQSVTGRRVRADVQAHVINSTSSARVAGVGIGIDSTTVDSSIIRTYAPALNTGPREASARYLGYPGIGYHTIAWLEYGPALDTQTWYGDIGVAPQQSGLLVELIG